MPAAWKRYDVREISELARPFSRSPERSYELAGRVVDSQLHRQIVCDHNAAIRQNLPIGDLRKAILGLADERSYLKHRSAERPTGSPIPSRCAVVDLAKIGCALAIGSAAQRKKCGEGAQDDPAHVRVLHSDPIGTGMSYSGY